MKKHNQIDDGTVIVESIKIPLALVEPFAALLAESAKHASDRVLVVNKTYGTVQCRSEYVPHVRLLWAGFKAGWEFADAKLASAGIGPLTPAYEGEGP